MKLKAILLIVIALFSQLILATTGDIEIQGKYSKGMFVEFKTTYIATVDHRSCMSKFYTEDGQSWLEPKQLAGKTKVKETQETFLITEHVMQPGFCKFERLQEGLQLKVHHPHLTMLGRKFKDVFYLIQTIADLPQVQVIRGLKVGDGANYSNKIKWDTEEVLIGPSGKIKVEFIVE